MTAVLLPQGKQQYFTAAGIPLVAGKVFTYDTGTSNPRTTWADAAQTAPNANPVILDARGEAPIFWSGAYRVVVQDSLGNAIWTMDGVSDRNYTDTLLRTDLATSNNATLGAKLVGFDPTIVYTGSTVGGFLSSIYGKSALETAVGATISSYLFPKGDPRRSSLYTNPNWLDFGDVPTFISATSFSVPGDVTGRYPFASYLRLIGAGASICDGRVQAAVFAAGITTFTFAVYTGAIPNPGLALAKSMAMQSDAPTVTRYDLNQNIGTFFWNVNNGANATSKVSVAIGQSGLGSDTAVNIAAVGSAHVTEYLPGSGITGKQIVIHTGTPTPILIGVNDGLKMLFPGAITSATQCFGSEESMRFISPRADDLGGIYIDFYEDDNSTRKGYVGFSNGGGNNTLDLTNEKAASNTKITATKSIWLSNAGGNTGQIFVDSAAFMGICNGNGNPNGVVTANPGSDYFNSAGGAGVSKYVKEAGVGTNANWVGK